MTNIILKAGTEQEFFQRGQALARLADAGQMLPEERIISFEDPAELLRLLTASRLDVFRSIKDDPGSITVIAARLHRDRSAVKRGWCLKLTYKAERGTKSIPKSSKCDRQAPQT